jgi:hypothetical protein
VDDDCVALSGLISPNIGGIICMYGFVWADRN